MILCCMGSGCVWTTFRSSCIYCCKARWWAALHNAEAWFLDPGCLWSESRLCPVLNEFFNLLPFKVLSWQFNGGNGNPLQYSCLENPMDRGAWWATVHGVSKRRTRLRTEWLTTAVRWCLAYSALLSSLFPSSLSI